MDKSKYEQLMAEAAKDERFAHILQNPLYRRVPKREKKVDIDKRFQSMFHDKNFKLKYQMDKRGRPINTTSNENLKRLYHLDSESDEEDKDEEQEEKLIKSKKGKLKKKSISSKQEKQAASSSDEQDSDAKDEEEEEEGDEKIEGHFDEPDTKNKTTLTKTEKKKLHSTEIDYTRGEGRFVSESSSDGDSSDSYDEEVQNDVMHEWGEMDKDAPRTEEPTTRLALCNMDWDRINATDLMVLFHSFLPPGGGLKSVAIYTSEYGKERLAEEDLNGPKELIESMPKSDNEESEEESESEETADVNDGEEDEEGAGYDMEKLRKYQLQRLKYYYAVLEFDTKESADKIYTECDGMEYESSATRIDVRFVPEDMVFDDEPNDICTAVPDGKKYQPRFFTTTALQQIKVDLTWDETDPRRKELTEKLFDSKNNVDDEDIKAYLASSSSDSEPENDDVIDENDEKKDSISKYKALLQSLEDTERKKKDKDVQMEITWGVGLKEKSEKLVKKKLEEENAAKMTPWEEMLAKRREKRKLHKAENKKQQKQEKNDEDSESKSSSSENDDHDDDNEDDKPFSDDEVDIDMMNDPYFKEEMLNNEVFKQSKNKNSKNNKKKLEKLEKVIDEKDDLAKKKKAKEAELELLLMDEEEDKRRHFSLKKIMEEEEDDLTNKKKKKRKMKRKKDALKNKELIIPSEKDDFQVDFKDDRFSALYSSHLYNVDPSDPNYKKTKGMDAIISEKQKRRFEKNSYGTNEPSKSKDPASVEQEKVSEEVVVPPKKAKSDLSYLIKSVKSKTQNMQSKNSNIKDNYAKFKLNQKLNEKSKK